MQTAPGSFPARAPPALPPLWRPVPREDRTVLPSAAAGGSEPPPLPARWGPPTLAAALGRRFGGSQSGDRARVAVPGGELTRFRPASPRGSGRQNPIRVRPQIRRDDPLNLSILLSGGKETNKDSLSSGERRGKSPAPNPRPGHGAREMWRTEDRFSRRGPGAQVLLMEA